MVLLPKGDFAAKKMKKMRKKKKKKKKEKKKKKKKKKKKLPDRTFVKSSFLPDSRAIAGYARHFRRAN
jgi:hypothetical protein